MGRHTRLVSDGSSCLTRRNVVPPVFRTPSSLMQVAPPRCAGFSKKRLWCPSKLWVWRKIRGPGPGLGFSRLFHLGAILGTTQGVDSPPKKQQAGKVALEPFEPRPSYPQRPTSRLRFARGAERNAANGRGPRFAREKGTLASHLRGTKWAPFRSPGRIRFPCKYEQTRVSTMSFFSGVGLNHA